MPTMLDDLKDYAHALWGKEATVETPDDDIYEFGHKPNSFFGGIYKSGEKWRAYTYEYDPGNRDTPPDVFDVELEEWHPNYFQAIEALAVELEKRRINNVVCSVSEGHMYRDDKSWADWS